jgi:hypothetical protein
MRRGGGSSGGGSFGGRSSGGGSFGGRSSSGGRGGKGLFGGSGSGGGHGLFGRSGSGGGRGLSGRSGSSWLGRLFFGDGSNPETGWLGNPRFPAIFAAVVVFIIPMLWIGIFFITDMAEKWPTRSSYQREALPAGIVKETGYIRDDAKWLVNQNAVQNSMRNFYKATGIQPYLWIAERINGSRDASWEEIETAMNALYKKQFTDEGHLILLFYEPRKGVYKTSYRAGSAAKTVIDDEASRIILDYFDKYYYSNMEEDEYFATVFDKSADRIMHVSLGVKHVLLAIAGLIALFILYRATAMILRHRRLKRQQNIDILNADVSRIGGDEAERLAEKYQDKQDTGNGASQN